MNPPAMDSDTAGAGDGTDRPSTLEPDYTFAFNDINFSDRILSIEIVPDLPETQSDDQGLISNSDWTKNRKRRRVEIKDDNDVDALTQPDDHILIPDSDGVVIYQSLGKEVVPVQEKSPAVEGEETLQNNNSSLAKEDSTVIEVKTIHISSIILAARSSFFHKLFSNGMRESEQKLVTLRIHASEEAALMDLLNFIYSNTLKTNTRAGLLDVLMVADKYGVTSCIVHGSRLLQKFPMTTESALLYLDLPSSVAKAAAPLTGAAKKFLSLQFSDTTKFQEEIINLPLAAIEAVLSSDSLHIDSEDLVYDLALKWARTHYPELKERQKIFSNHLCNVIRFPFMTYQGLAKVITCRDMERDIALNLVLKALLLKAAPPFSHRKTPKFRMRAYKYRALNVIGFTLPHKHCIVYLDLKKEECQALFPSDRIQSHRFHLDGRAFYLIAKCNMEQQSGLHYFGFFLSMYENRSGEIPVEFEFSVRQKPSEDFVSKFKGNSALTGSNFLGFRNFFSTPWTSLMEEDNKFFINGYLHLRVELTIKQ